jgi:hypothetical protein
LTNVQSEHALKLVPAAAIANGADPSTAFALLAAFPLGAGAIANVTGTTPAMIAAAGAAFQESYVIGLRTTALSSLSFGIVGIIGKFGSPIVLIGLIGYDSMPAMPRHWS